MNKLLVLLALLSTTATAASDWTLSDRVATTGDLNNYSTVATLFISTDSQTSIGFSVYDPECEGFSPEIKPASIHIINDQPVKFQYQCQGKAEKLFMPKYKTGRDFIMDEFKERKTVWIKTVGSNFTFSYSAMGFTEAYNAIESIAWLTRNAI